MNGWMVGLCSPWKVCWNSGHGHSEGLDGFGWWILNLSWTHFGSAGTGAGALSYRPQKRDVGQILQGARFFRHGFPTG